MINARIADIRGRQKPRVCVEILSNELSMIGPEMVNDCSIYS